MISVGVGFSKQKDSFEAGKKAALSALKEMGSSTANVLIVFAAPSFDHQKLLDGIVSVTKKTPMIGGSTAGEIYTKSVESNSVIIMALKSDTIKFAVGIGTKISEGEVEAGKMLANSLIKQISLKECKTLIMLPDGLAGNGTEIICGVKKVFGELFEIVGGSLGDEDKFKKTYQYYNGKVYEDSVPGLVLAGENLVTATGIRAGWKAVGNKIKVTKAKSNVVYELDGLPALDYYEKALGPERSKKLPAIALEYPFGMVDETAKVGKELYFQLRAPLSVDREKKSITFAAEIPEGKDIVITTASLDSVIEGSNLAAKQAKEIMGGVKPDFMLIFDCIGRRLVLGKRVQEEVDAVQEHIGKNVPLTGFFTYGEIGPVDKRIKTLQATRYHNQTTIVFLLGEKDGKKSKKIKKSSK